MRDEFVPTTHFPNKYAAAGYFWAKTFCRPSFLLLLMKFYETLEYDFGHEGSRLLHSRIQSKCCIFANNGAGICWISTIYHQRMRIHIGSGGKKWIFVCSLSPFCPRNWQFMNIYGRLEMRLAVCDARKANRRYACDVQCQAEVIILKVF